jgi:hypothetical protein
MTGIFDDTMSYSGQTKAFDNVSQNVTDTSSNIYSKAELPVPDDKNIPNEDALEQGLLEFLRSPERQPSLGQLSEMSFQADLPQLLKEHQGKWAAYVGKDRIAIEDTREKIMNNVTKYCKRHNIAGDDVAWHKVAERE